MEIEKIKELISAYERIVEEPSPLYAQFILDCLYLLFLYKTGRNEVYLSSQSVESFKPDIEGIKEIIGNKKEKLQRTILSQEIATAFQELVSFLEKEEGYVSNDSLVKRANIFR